jgi:hypothetical protein
MSALIWDGARSWNRYSKMPRASVAVLLKHFPQSKNGREPWRVLYPLTEILLVLTCATIASRDDFDDIAA